MKPSSAAACCMLAAVLALCVMLQALGARGGGGGEGEEEGSSEGQRRQPSVLLLYSCAGEVASWFSASTNDTLYAARLAWEDIAARALMERSGWPLNTIELLEEAFVGCSIQVNSSVVAVVSGDCTDASCHARSLPPQLPVVSYSPSCLGATTTSTATAAAETEALSSHQFCMLPSLDHLPAGIAALISHFDWQRATVLSEEGNPLVMNSTGLLSELQIADVVDIRQFSLSSADSLPSDILHRDYRIVVLNLTPPLARAVLCEAVHQNRTQHVWIVPGWYPHGWWLGGSPTHNPDLSPQSPQTPHSCSDEELERFLGGGRRTLSVLQSPLNPLQQPQDNISAVFQEWCTAHDVVDCIYAAYAYDAMWTVATAFNSSLTSDLFHMAIAESNFSGASGRVEFDSAGYRQWEGTYEVAHYRYGEERLESVPIATLTEAPNEEGEAGEGGGGRGLLFAYVGSENQNSVWPDGVPPDGYPIQQLKHPLLVLVVVCYVLSGAVIVFAVICIVFNICFRNKKLIKLTSPNLNLFIAMGVILMNMGTPMTMYPPLFESELSIFCLVRTWAIPIGWSLCLSTITVKMWRVYIIYRTAMKLQSVKHKRLKRFLRDWHMMVVILGLVVVDVVVLVCSMAIPAARFQAQQVPDKEFPPYRDSEGIQVEYYNLQCISESGLIWVALLFGYKVMLQISGMVLAFLTRKVEVKGLNESREVQVVMIITTPIVVAALVLRLVLSDYLNVVGTVYALGVSLTGGTALSIIFIPKMVELCKNPSGDHIFLSKYHPQNLGSTNKLAFRGRSFTSSLSNLDPTSSLKSLFRTTSMDSALVLTERKCIQEDRDGSKINTVVRNVHFTLPKIEEASNEANTTDCSEMTTVNPFLPQGNVISQCYEYPESSESSNNMEDSISSMKFLLSIETEDTTDQTEEDRSSDAGSITGKQEIEIPGLVEENVAALRRVSTNSAPSTPTSTPELRAYGGRRNSVRDSWLVFNKHTDPPPHNDDREGEAAPSVSASSLISGSGNLEMLALRFQDPDPDCELEDGKSRREEEKKEGERRGKNDASRMPPDSDSDVNIPCSSQERICSSDHSTRELLCLQATSQEEDSAS